MISRSSEPETAREWARRINREAEGDLSKCFDLISRIPIEEMRTKVGHIIFGDKVYGDIGGRSTSGHPKTDFGEPSFAGAYDIDDK